MHAVHDDAPELVDDQVEPPRVTAQQRVRRLGGVEGDAEGPGEVVAGAERDQAEDNVAELLAPVQGCDHGVQAAVAPGHHDPTAAAPVQDPVQLALVGGRADLDVPVAAQDRHRSPDGVLVGAAGVGVGDDQGGFHGGDSTPRAGAGRW